MASFQAENAQWRALAAGQDLGRPYDLASSADIRAFFAGNRDLIGAWRGFYDRYPESGGFVRLSAVGFDASRTRGLVSIEHQCGFLCGSGGYLFVEKLGGVWRIVQVPGAIYCTWIS
jgi:hypothetical protein